LWKEYGIVFVDDALLYSVLAWASSFECRFEGSGKRLNDHLTYKAKFQASLRSAIRRDEITESHFFAALFAVLTSFHEISANGERTLREFKADNDELKAHQQGLLQILRRLGRHGPLQSLYNYALSLVRLWASESAVANINYEMHVVAEETPLPMTVTDPRATFALPARFWLDTGGTPTWQGLEWSMSDDIRALFSCFQMMLNGSDQLDYSIRALRQKITDMQRLPCVSAIFSYVHTSFSSSSR
jgi:hypothetical protein